MLDLYSENYVKTLSECSKDDKEHVNMIESKAQAINFDKVKEDYARSLGLNKSVVRSVDALLEHEPTNTSYMIEFKNGVLIRKSQSKDSMEDDNVKSFEIREKVRDSLLIYSDLIGKTISQIRDNMVFILVYNEAKNSLGPDLEAIHRKLAEKSGIEYVRFKLGCFQGIYFREVHTYTEAEFNKFLTGITAT